MSVRVCSQCASENDLTRVFCANCGMRLPEDAVESSSPAAAKLMAGGGAPALPMPAGRRVSKSARKPSERGLFGFLFSQLVSTILLAALLAALIQMVREPDNIPPRSGENGSAAQDVYETLRGLASSPHPGSWTVNQNAINSFLETTIKAAAPDSAESMIGAKFQRAFVRLGDGCADLGIEQNFLTRNIYLLLEFQPEPSTGGLGAKMTGGAIGRLPVPNSLLPVFSRLFHSTISGLGQPLAPIRQARTAAITPQDVKLQWDGSGTPSR
ncbi:MAG: hypothetical protein D4R65_15790 [Verrucomicrobiaceae bacterium]|nr:MAG: hypothetical protein D4R65_15790 [Verrucomicrobiaceae bacterium]